ncbi:hypothetical protein [Lysobacter capsici]|uniref:hypothetical protein n=1 Tax=Lysobacter capsici TaxID=435897 RepID=UPI001C008B38|nr:hypothetical protein [Lysobacter capsici]QWF19593.1 hypothetical protein KME82_13020 [Lysobacter capsici]
MSAGVTRAQVAVRQSRPVRAHPGEFFRDPPQAFGQRFIACRVHRFHHGRMAFLFVRAVGAEELSAADLRRGRGIQLRQHAHLGRLGEEAIAEA